VAPLLSVFRSIIQGREMLSGWREGQMEWEKAGFIGEPE
jgi:hypothetical protein